MKLLHGVIVLVLLCLTACQTTQETSSASQGKRDLFSAVVYQESSGRSRAESHAGAVGRAQLKMRSSNRTRSRRVSKKRATSARRVRVASLSAGGNIAPASERAKANSARYSALIAKHAQANGIPIALAHAVVRIESGYRAHVRGGAGEVGLMQIKPSTARAIGYRGSTRGLYNPDTNLRWGMKYLGGAYRRAGGKVCGTVLRYNAGHYARRMNRISARYCRKARRLMGTGSST